ncbi:hypothetical protein KQX54_009912 [Cotesia glomerata]|uniref:Uncharacterized protein n=1 Tax=Cotesia glomerata TaxID=32391 RepID=A0AAV7I046_COTGL|nr:hypothetical protein KQX54_009912 [Cotesia glomerata]
MRICYREVQGLELREFKEHNCKCLGTAETSTGPVPSDLYVYAFLFVVACSSPSRERQTNNQQLNANTANAFWVEDASHDARYEDTSVYLWFLWRYTVYSTFTLL